MEATQNKDEQDSAMESDFPERAAGASKLTPFKLRKENLAKKRVFDQLNASLRIQTFYSSHNNICGLNYVAIFNLKPNIKSTISINFKPLWTAVIIIP